MNIDVWSGLDCISPVKIVVQADPVESHSPGRFRSWVALGPIRLDSVRAVTKFDPRGYAMRKPLETLAWLALLVGPAWPVRGEESTGARIPEFAEMLGSILANGSNMGPYSGWFHPSQSRYGWAWLSDRFDGNQDGVLTADELRGSAPLFRALDRDGDGVVSGEDLDWTPGSRYLQGRSQARGRFGRMDRNGNGRVTREEWDAVFAQAARGKAFLTLDDVADVLYPPAATPAATARRGGVGPADGPTRWTLLKALFRGELGTASEGPQLGDDAPAFTLETHDRDRRVSLGDFRGRKPVVLIFGSFT